MATPWDIVLPRGRTAVIPYTVNLNGIADDLTGLTDLRWLAKLNPGDPDNAPGVLVKSYLNGGLTVLSPTAGTIQVRLNPADTAPPAFTADARKVVVYLGLVLYLPGTTEVEYDLFAGQRPSLTLLQGVGQATT